MKNFDLSITELYLYLNPSELTKSSSYCRERAEALSENHAFRGAVFRESSTTDSGTDQRCVLPVSFDRSRNKFGMTPAEPALSKQSILTDDVKRICHPELASGSGPCCELSLMPVESASLGLRLALNANARACNQERGLACRALDSTQCKPCSVALLGLAFTMAEILLSLTIIGVVAAITLPSLTGNINERTWNTQRKALYARFSQAIALMPALNGYGTLTEGDSSTSAVDTAAETFVTNGLAKVLKINNICDSDHLQDCGIVSSFTNSYGSKIDTPKTMQDFNSSMTGSASNTNGMSYSLMNTKAAAFETANGESIIVYYNPACSGKTETTSGQYSQLHMCANFVYDLNGSKGPNTYGKDIGFITALYSSDPVVVAPHITKVLSLAGGYINNSKTCRSLETESRIPNLEEVEAIFYNSNITGVSLAPHCFWSSTHISSEKVWRVCYTGIIYQHPIESNNEYAVCVQR